MREQRRARLRVINRAANITAIRGANDDRRREVVVRSPAHRRELVANLHVRGPDVIEELNFDDRLEPANGQSDRAANDVRLGERRVVNALASEFLLKSPGDLEYAALALDLVEILLA